VHVNYTFIEIMCRWGKCTHFSCLP